MLIKLHSLQHLDAALDMTDCSGNKLFTYITAKVNESSGRYEIYSLELRSGRPSAATGISCSCTCFNRSCDACETSENFNREASGSRPGWIRDSLSLWKIW